MNRLTQALLCGLAASALIAGSASASLIDFNQVQGSDGDFTIANITNTPLGATGVTVTFAGTISDSSSGTNHQGAYTIDAAEDYFFVRGTNSNGAIATITLSGLTGPAYDISIYSAVANSATLNATRLADITVNGAFSDGGESDDYSANSDGFGSGTVLLFSNVVPSSGSIDVIIQTPAGDPLPGSSGTNEDNYIGFINALEFVVIPEPGSLALLGLGVLCLLSRRRTQNQAPD